MGWAELKTVALASMWSHISWILCLCGNLCCSVISASLSLMTHDFFVVGKQPCHSHAEDRRCTGGLSDSVQSHYRCTAHHHSAQVRHSYRSPAGSGCDHYGGRSHQDHHSCQEPAFYGRKPGTVYFLNSSVGVNMGKNIKWTLLFIYLCFVF